MKNIIYILSLVFFISCDIINPEEQIPSYLKIEDISLNASPYFSSNSENITDAWVYINSNLVGAFELPCEIPILSEGSTNVRIIPGIYKDGIKSHHHFYPYYTNVDTIINFIPEKTITISPTINYTGNYQTIFNEDFEGIDLQFEASSNSAFPLEVSDKIKLDGLKSGYILADATDKKMELVSKNEFQIITRTLPSYLEIDYVSSVEFIVGIITENGEKNHELRLRPNASRKKIYVDISAETGVFDTDTKFKIYFEATSGKSGDYIALDNIRLLIPN